MHWSERFKDAYQRYCARARAGPWLLASILGVIGGLLFLTLAIKEIGNQVAWLWLGVGVFGCWFGFDTFMRKCAAEYAPRQADDAGGSSDWAEGNELDPLRGPKDFTAPHRA